jgi:hypothetical protein
LMQIIYTFAICDCNCSKHEFPRVLARLLLQDCAPTAQCQLPQKGNAAGGYPVDGASTTNCVLRVLRHWGSL